MNDEISSPVRLRSGRVSPEISLGVSPPASIDTIEAMADWLQQHGV